MAQTSLAISPQLLRNWSIEAQRALDDAVHRHSHKQAGCSTALKALGANGASQQMVSSWLRKPPLTPRGLPRRLTLANAQAISSYLAEAGIYSLRGYFQDDVDIPSGGSAGPGHEIGFGPEPLNPDDFVAGGEPELGGRRARLIDILLDRLAATTEPLGAVEERIIAWISLVERFEQPYPNH